MALISSLVDSARVNYYLKIFSRMANFNYKEFVIKQLR